MNKFLLIKKDNIKKIVLIISIIICFFLLYIVNIRYEKEVVYTHFFYIPIILTGIWFHKKAFLPAVFFGFFHILFNFLVQGELGLSLIIRSFIFIVVAYLVGDISKRLQKNQEKIESYIKNVPIGVFIADEQGRYLEVNPAASTITGYTSEELLKKRITDLLAPQDIVSGTEHFKEVADIGHAFGEYRYLHKSGEIRHWTVNAVRLSPKRFIGYVQDITSRKNTEKALCEQKNFSENVINTARVIILNLDTEGRIINFNPYMEEISGFSIADVKGQDWFETFLPTGQQSSVRKIFCDAIYDIKTHGNINAVKTKSGQLRYIEWYDSTIKDEVGNVQGLLAVGIDITNRKKYEEEREELLQRMQNMFNEHTAAMLIIEPVTGKIIDANPAACSFYGYTQEEMLKMHIQKINMLLKEEVEKRRLMAANRKQKYFLFPHRLKNGDIKMVDVYSAPVTYSGQKMLFSIIFDVTDREKYREELFWEKEQFKTTLLSVGDGVISTDFQGKVQLINKVAQQLTGWTQEEAFERPLEEVFNIINENTREKCENPAYKVLNTGQVVELDNHTVLISKEGAEIPIEDSAAPIRDKGDNITGVVLVFRDCTEKKEKRKKILYLSYHDQLTGLYNRRFYEEELKRIDTKRHFPLTIMMMDVNGLKLINDAFGHSIGDQVLIKTAEVLKRECRTDDIIARIGGDEFVMLLPMTDSKQAECIAERIKQVVEIEKIKSINISISLGWEIKKDNLVETDIIIKKAEDNMYKSKITESASHRNNTIALIMKTLFEKSQREEKHSKRVAALSRLIAAKLGLSLEKINIIKTAGLLHDIGKITISEKVLNKSTSLGKDEWNEIKRHPETGYNILKSVEEYAHIAEYILNHHEKWDGTGYPRGLKGKEIPLQSRILAVADAYDAMTMERPYKKAMNKKEVTAELKKYSETQFDPEIVRIFIEKIISNQ